ncbi:TonB-dependent receptor [Sphingomonas sp. SM33]|uniref:TonB-dependent receptor n=1 Tax=Sphingomonas telluris TaxID=2907998 RepID=A0ABS9VNR0_9SPHN|nr:TonB-dependent receptor [Sphingomonas telluris]MCH8616619.1 TonB-dependent receptor [Sphingomonas telluris]
MSLTTAAAALCAGTAAHAQSEQASSSQPADASAPKSPDQPSLAGSEGEIVVTAQKRPEILQDVPISISVVAGDQMRKAGATQLVDLSGYVPGLQVDSAGTPGQTTVTLRGVTPLTGAQTVGIYVDDAPVGSSSIYARSSIFSLDLLPYDINRLEILRGPQGTLYGASSIGGLIKYVTVTPSLTRTSGVVGGEVFDIDHAHGFGYAGQALINTPVVQDRVGLSASIAYRKSPGYVNNVQTGRRDQNDYDQLGGRLSLLVKPNDRFSARFSAIYQKVDSDNNAQVVEEISTGERLGDGYANNNYLDEPFTKKFQFYSGTLDYDFGFATLTSATSYSSTKIRQTIDASRVYGSLYPLLTGGAIPAGLAPFDLSLDLDKVTEEVRLTSPNGGRFEWLVGGFYTHEETENRQVVPALTMNEEPIPALNPLAEVSLPTTYREFAIFGNGTFHLTDSFDFTGGMRWARNKQDFRQITSGLLFGTPKNIPGQSDEDVFTFSVSPQIHLGETAMIYGRIATGYLPGGPNVAVPGVPPQVQSSRLTSYEIGIKGTLIDPRLSFEFAAYDLEWKKIQLTEVIGGVSAAVNGGRARSRGIEGSLIFHPVPALSLAANGSYVDAYLTEDAPPIGGLDGDRLPNAPKWSGSLTADYSFDVGSNRANVGAGVRHIGRRLSLVESSPGSVPAAAYTTLDAHGELTVDQHWTVRIYGRNLTGSKGAVSRTLLLGLPIQYTVIPVQPRTFGLAAEYAF